MEIWEKLKKRGCGRKRRLSGSNGSGERFV